MNNWLRIVVEKKEEEIVEKVILFQAFWNKLLFMLSMCQKLFSFLFLLKCQSKYKNIKQQHLFWLMEDFGEWKDEEEKSILIIN